jgi:hypothetical protein
MRSLFLLAACVVLCPSDVDAQEPSAKEILQRFVKLSGGKENYAKLKSYEMTAEISVPAISVKFPLTMSGTLNPTQQLQVLDQAGTITRRYYTEKLAWEDGPTGKRLITGIEKGQATREASFLPELTPDRFYKSLKVVGTEKVNGDNCYKLELIPKVGKKETAFYSVASGFKRRVIQDVLTPNGEIRVQTTISDYRKIDGGLRISFKTEQKLTPLAAPNQITNLVVNLKKCEINKAIPELTFKVPSDVAAMATAAAKKSSKAATGK